MFSNIDAEDLDLDEETKDEGKKGFETEKIEEAIDTAAGSYTDSEAKTSKNCRKSATTDLVEYRENIGRMLYRLLPEQNRPIHLNLRPLQMWRSNKKDDRLK